ncbi:MAG: cyclase [Acidobacteria bacterium]|nr:MAG: cyclase [Acidobacteriota bacterium]
MNFAASTYGGRAGSGEGRREAFQRWSALVGGSALALLGLTRRSKSGVVMAAAGGALAYLGARTDRAPRVLFAQSSILLNSSPQEVFRFWRNFENIALFMPHVESVIVSSNGRSTWTVLGPLGARIVWDAEIINERENELIEWRSLPGSAVDVDGTVRLRPATGNRGIILEVRIRYRSRTTAVARALFSLFTRYPSFVLRQDLRRCKALIETGEIPTTEGQPHGPRSALIGALRLADPSRPTGRIANVKETIATVRRIA